MLAGVDVGVVLAAVIPLAGSIVAGGLAMAWRLGGLERTVKDTAGDAHEAKVEAQKAGREAQKAQSAVAELRVLVDRRRARGDW